MIITKEIFEKVLEIIDNCCPSEYLRQLCMPTEYEKRCVDMSDTSDCDCQDCWREALNGLDNDDIIFKRGE